MDVVGMQTTKMWIKSLTLISQRRRSALTPVRLENLVIYSMTGKVMVTMIM